MRNNFNSRLQFNIYLVRHGETEENKSGIIQGQSNTFLSEIGIQQAIKLGQKLSNIKFNRVYSSDLTRAIDTANHILSQNNHGPFELIQDRLLRERKFGVAEGTKRKDLIELAATYGKTTTDFVPKGAETTPQVFMRAVEFFENLCKNYRLINEKETNLNEISHKFSDIKSNSIKIETQEDVNLSNENSLSSSYNSIDEELNSKKCITYENLGVERYTSQSPSSGYVTDNLESPIDEYDYSNLPVYDILIVSHGALIREMLKYFVHDLRCEIPCEKSSLKDVPPNTALSKFTVTLGDSPKDLPRLICNCLSDKSHLIDTDLDVKNKCSL